MEMTIVYPTAQGAIGVMRATNGDREVIGYFDSWNELLRDDRVFTSLVTSNRSIVIVPEHVTVYES